MRTHDNARLTPEILERGFPYNAMPRGATGCAADRVGNRYDGKLFRRILCRERQVRAIFPGLVVSLYGKAFKYVLVRAAGNAIAPEDRKGYAETFLVPEQGFLQAQARKRRLDR